MLTRVCFWIAMLGLIAAAVTAAPTLLRKPPSLLAEEQANLRYSSSLALAFEGAAGSGEEVSSVAGSIKPPSHKSPGKAFLLSAAIPGLGQLYNGDRIKGAAFLATDVVIWALHIKWHADGDDLTDAFNTYNEDHWSREAYRQYLLLAYDEEDDDLIDATEVSHHLPESNTQQYYEMTGKYDQFSWGWDDAQLNGDTLEEFSDTIPPAVGTNIPQSAHRLIYEDMRHDANSRYDRAQAMLIAAMVNRLISGFEAFLAARRHNAHGGNGTGEFSRVSVRTSLKTVYSRCDTPFLKLAYRF